MKKLLAVVMVLGTLATHAQNYQPLLSQCSYYHPNSEEYRVHFYNEVMKDLDYRKTLLVFVNTALEKSGENKNLNEGKPLGDLHIWWIIKQIKFDSVHIGKNESFTNTRKDSHTKKTEQYEDFKQKNFMAGTFNYKSCHMPTFIKSDCFNWIDLHRVPDQVNPEDQLVIDSVPEKPCMRTVEYVYIHDTVSIPGEKIIEYREVEREKIAAETHAQNMSGSTSSSNSYYHQSSEEINQMDYSKGTGVAVDLAGLFQTVCLITGIGDGKYQSNNTQVRTAIAITPREDMHVYSSKRSMNGGATSSNTTSFNQNNGNQNGNGNNQNNQNQNNQQSGGRRQPSYNPDPNSFVGTARTAD